MGYPASVCKTKIIFPSGNFVIVDIPSNTKLTEHFEIGELANWKNNESIKYTISFESLQFLKRIEEFRKWYAKPMICNCNWRSQYYNDALEGSIKNSEHVKGTAFDWGITTHTESQRNNVKNKIFSMAKSYGCGCYVIFYKWGYHIDFSAPSCICIDKRK